MKKIKVCFHIGNISNCGGTEKVTTQIASLLLEKYDNYDVTILSSYYNIITGPYFKGNSKIKYDRLFEKEVSFKKNYFKMIERLNKYITQNDIDILIGVDTIQALFDIPAIKQTKCKYIAWEHFNYNYNLGKKLRNLGRWYSAKKASALVVLTDKDKKYFSDNLKIKSKLVRIYNPFVKDKIKEKYNEKSNIIMSSGRLTYQKGFDILIEVARLLKEKTENFKWIILGEGEDRAKLESKIEEYELSNLVELKGKVKNVADYYKQSKLFVLSSRFEGLGLVVLEAKSYALPVISFNCDCGPSEMIRNNINGYIIKDYKKEEMCEKIYELLNDEKKCIEFSEKSEMDMEKFMPDVIVKEWDKLIKEVINK